MIDKTAIEAIVHEYLNATGDPGYFVTNVEVRPSNEVLVEIDHDSVPIDLDTLTALSRYIGEHQDRDIEDYELTVMSAGLTEPLVLPRQYLKHVGHEMEVTLRSGVKEEGVLVSAGDSSFVLEVTRMVKAEGQRRKQAVSEQMTIPYADAKRVVYVLKV